tara:strand:+ start:8800 stop:9198 length:399 start_codon:yes stop_codon:yes gene_type:complete
MTAELLAMLGGSASGFIMKLIGSQMEHQARQFERLISMQQESDDSADRAAQREGGVIVRRFLVVATVFAIVIAPFIFAWTNVDISVSRETEGFLGMFKTVKWEGIKGFVILPEIRQTALAIVGFYFGSSQIK